MPAAVAPAAAAPIPPAPLAAQPPAAPPYPPASVPHPPALFALLPPSLFHYAHYSSADDALHPRSLMSNDPGSARVGQAAGWCCSFFRLLSFFCRSECRLLRARAEDNAFVSGGLLYLRSAQAPTLRSSSHVSFGERSHKLTTLPAESVGRLGVEGRNFIDQLAANVMGGRDGGSMARRGW